MFKPNMPFLAPEGEGGGATPNLGFGYSSGSESTPASGSSASQSTPAESFDFPYDFGNAEGDQAPGQSQTVKIKYRGEEKELPLEEVVPLAQQGLDYTQKMQALAEQRKQVEQAGKLMEFLQSDPTLSNYVAQRIFEQQTGMPYTPETVQQVQYQQAAEHMQMQQATLQNADMLLRFKSAHPEVTDSQLESVVMYMAQERIPSAEAAYKALMFDVTSRAGNLQSRPRLAQGYGAPAPARQAPKTFAEASQQARAILQAGINQNNAY